MGNERASRRQKKIMDLFESEDELYSNEIKARAGFEKGGEKGFEGTITDLQMKTYLCDRITGKENVHRLIIMGFYEIFFKKLLS